MSTRAQIVAAVETALKQIKAANGYQTEAGRRVFVNRDLAAKPLTTNELPAVTLTEGETERTVLALGVADYRLEVELEAWADGAGAATEARKGLADLAAAIGADDTLGGLAIQTTVELGEIKTEHADRLVASAGLTATVHYRGGEWEV